jgi:hypothetical protein
MLLGICRQLTAGKGNVAALANQLTWNISGMLNS